MDNNLTIDLIINNENYSKIYHFTYILLSIILISIYIIFTYKYQTYYHLKGRMVSNEIELLVPIDDIQLIASKHDILIDNQIYTYQITHISEELYLDNNYHNYRYIYIKINNLSNIDNYVYSIKIAKENKTLAKYLKDYL